MEQTLRDTNVAEDPIRCRVLNIKGSGDLPDGLSRFGVAPYGMNGRSIVVIVGRGDSQRLVDAMPTNEVITINRFTIEPPAR